MIFVLFCIVVAVYALHQFIHNNENAKIFNKVPGPRVLPVLGNSLDFIKGQVPLFYRMRKLANEYNGIYRMWVIRNSSINVYSPETVEAVLNSQKHITKNRIYQFLHPWLNDGLLTSTGAKWQKRRKILTPAFHFNILKQFCNIFVEQSDVLVKKLKKTQGQPVEILPYITDFALHSICETAMGTNLDSDLGIVQKYKKAIYDIGEYIIYRTFRIWLYPTLILSLTPTGMMQRKTLKTLHKFTTDVIRERREERNKYGDKFNVEDYADEVKISSKKRLAMLDLLLSAESDGNIDENGIREEVDTFMFEGHDTTTMAIVFCLMLLANNPEVQKQAADEVDSILTDPSKPVAIEDLNNMRYLERCIKEALRLFPSVPLIGREIVEDVKMGDYVIPGGSSCNIHIFDLHRDAKIYPNPLKFDPDRFLPENCTKRHPFAYIPFSAGPRNCIGQKFAILEEKAIISAVLKNFRLEAVTTPDDILFSLDLILRSKNPVVVKFIPRTN